MLVNSMEIIALYRATSVFDQKNLSEYKSHLIIGYFQSSGMDIRYLSMNVTICTYITLLITNMPYIIRIACIGYKWNHITLYSKLHVQFISRNVGTFVPIIKINKCKTNYKHVLQVMHTHILDCIFKSYAPQFSSTQAQYVVYEILPYFHCAVIAPVSFLLHSSGANCSKLKF